MSKQKYCLRQDDDCHWYLIPIESKKYFDELMERVAKGNRLDLKIKDEDRYTEEDYYFLDKCLINSYLDIEFYLE